MNRQAIRDFIDAYKANIDNITKLELYKWKAVKHFHDTFNLDAPNLSENFELAFSKTENLLLSRNHYPARMVIENAEKSPNQVRDLFNFLFDEDISIVERIRDFKDRFKLLSETHWPEKDHYQYHHSIFAYLTLRYPELYYFYKFGTVKSFAEMVDFPGRFKLGSHDNIGLFLSLCDEITELAHQDQELIKLHEARLDSECYRDQSLHLLAQDILYSAVRHLPNDKGVEKTSLSVFSDTQEESSNYYTPTDEVHFDAALLNHVEIQRRNERLGTAGELWVLKYEKDYLIKNGKPNLAEKVEHSAKEKGDGLGYDILSRELSGRKKYIEVKTTSGPVSNPFFMTNREMERSRKEGDRYFIYRLYNFDKEKNTCDLLKLTGDQSHLCVNPVNFKISLKKK